MNQTELDALLTQLIKTWENEIIEFKEAANNYDTNKIGQYFSALANEANLRDAKCAWLIFGVSNKTHQIVGSDYRCEPERLQSLKAQIADDTEPSITFHQIHELHHAQGRVVLFEIPAAPRGIPIAWKGHYYARTGESLTPLQLNKLDEIRDQTRATDWSAQIVEEAKFSDLDEMALAKAREVFTQKNANRFNASEIQSWSLATFLDRARLTQNGKITRTALLLLGKAESAFYLSPHPAQITWSLQGAERAYEHFSPPFLLNTTTIYQKIRNIQIRLLPHNELVPFEIAKYEQKSVLEALHNCIAHQDYTRFGRIIVNEKVDRLIFENEGDFFEGKPEDYLSDTKSPRRYRNAFLVEAMASLNMIDKMGFGIFDMTHAQFKRYLPLPDYTFDEPSAVKMTIYGSVVDPAYTQILMQQSDLTFEDALALDRVQKSLKITDAVANRLRKAKLIEGRKPNFHVSAKIAAATDKKAAYIRMRTQDDAHYAKLLLDYLAQYKKASRAEIDVLLKDKLSELLNEKQKDNKIRNLITSLREKGKIQNIGNRKTPQWVLIN